MKIFYVGLQYDHYNPKHGLSFEHNNFYASLRAYPGAAVTYFPLDEILTIGRRAFNQKLLDAVTRERPDAVFFFMHSDELDPRALDEMKRYTKTIAWFADDSWRFYNYSRFWARHFAWVVTTYSWMPALYKKAGQPNVIRSQWGANTAMYTPANAALSGPDVSFVGGWTRPRRKILDAVRASGVALDVRGAGWDAGKVSDAEMIGIFSGAKINLGLNPPPGMWTRKSIGRLLLAPSINTFRPSFHLWGNLQTFFHQNVPQVKARHFEIPACGGFLLTAMADDLGAYYEVGKEIVVYKNTADLVDKIRYYLAHDDERKAIAMAGYRRTIKDHTYERRFHDIFTAIGI